MVNKTTIYWPNKQKGNFAHAAHFFCTFLCGCFARLQRKTSRNFLVSYTFYGRNFVLLVLPCRTTFFLLPFIFTLVATTISHFLTATTKFSCCSSNKKCFLYFLSFAVALCHSFSRWALLAGRLLSLFLCLCLSLYSKCVDITIILDNTDTETIISAFCYVIIDSASQYAGGYVISCQNNLELHLGWQLLFDWVTCHWYACGAGR